MARCLHRSARFCRRAVCHRHHPSLILHRSAIHRPIPSRCLHRSARHRPIPSLYLHRSACHRPIPSRCLHRSAHHRPIPSFILHRSAIHLCGHGNGLCCARGRLGAAGDHVCRLLLTIFHPLPLTLFHLIGLVVSLLTTYFANVIIFIGLVVTDVETEMDSAGS